MMLKIFKCVFILATAGFLAAAQPAIAADAVNLVDVNWLARNLRNADVLILDASPAPQYAANHIPGALSASIQLVNTPSGLQEMPPAEVEKLYQTFGISYGKKIVVYDQGGSMSATRLFYSLYYYGFPPKDLFLLDGGLSKWKEKGMAVTQEVLPAPKGTFTIKSIHDDARAKLPEVLTASGDPANNALVEGLAADWHFGQTRAFNRAGHIPNGILMPSTEFFNPDKTFKSAAEIEKMLAFQGIKPEQNIFTYCGGGVAASVPYFALKFIVKYPKVKLFTASELGWLADERELPYWTYDAPFLMRDAHWLSSWNAPMLRMYAGARLSVIDVRTADAFNQGHLPFAINVPAEIFKNNFATPDKLAAILGQAGVDVSHEAVAVSGAGLSKESALAFLMLEKLGQKKTSVLMDATDKWSQPGVTLTKDATVVGPKKGPNDLSIPPTSYPSNLRPGVVVAESTTGGVYPKVFIASGKDIPAKVQDGKVVHVPYTDLLNADGTPKPANDIWNILTKAGVPRYAELICISDDPGEAAANYFILKLMGFPDIKVKAI